MRRAAFLVIAFCGFLALSATLDTPLRVAAEAPTKASWWNYAYQVPGAQPPSTTTNPTDLFVEGRYGDEPVSPVSPPPPFETVGSQSAAQAIAALSFPVPPGEVPDSVTLLFASGKESETCSAEASENPLGSSCLSDVACPTTSDWKAELNGPWADLPTYNCNYPSSAALSPSTTGMTFTDMGSLVQGSTLSFVIVPTFYDYEDLLYPGPDSLTFRPASLNASFNDNRGFNTSSGGNGFSVPGSSTYVPGSSVPATTGTQPSPSPTPHAAGTSGQRTRVPASVSSTIAFIVPNTWFDRLLAAILLGLTVTGLALLAMQRTGLWSRLGLAPAAPTAEARTGRGLGRFVQPRSGRPLRL